MRQDLNPQWTVTGTERVRGHERELVMRMATAPVDTLTLDPDNRRLFAVMQDKYSRKLWTLNLKTKEGPEILQAYTGMLDEAKADGDFEDDTDEINADMEAGFRAKGFQDELS